MKPARDLITAKVICDSVAHKPTGIRMTTFEIEYPRFILAELNTHRMLSKNSASSRAIPIKTMHEHILANTAQPVHWGLNQPGMKARSEADTETINKAKQIWQEAIAANISYSQKLDELGLHKQVANRLTEAGMIMKTVISGTEWRNFFWLRDHADADPTIGELARKMMIALEGSTPTVLAYGDWHLPYVNSEPVHPDMLAGFFRTRRYYDNAGTELTLEQAQHVSASCCAQVSYRKNDDSLEKAEKVFKMLIESEPCHASPVEHQATPMFDAFQATYQPFEPDTWEPGITHMDRSNQFWSGNLRGWIQFRKLIPGEAKW